MFRAFFVILSVDWIGVALQLSAIENQKINQITFVFGFFSAGEITTVNTVAIETQTRNKNFA